MFFLFDFFLFFVCLLGPEETFTKLSADKYKHGTSNERLLISLQVRGVQASELRSPNQTIGRLLSQ